MVTVAELRQKKAEAVAEMKSMLDKADAEKRELTVEEEARYTALDKAVDEADAGIKAVEASEARRDKVSALSAEINAPQKRLHAPAVIIPGKVQNDEEFRNIGEYFYTLRNNPNDKRLAELREQTMGTGASGGYAIPEQFQAQLLEVQPSEAVVRPRATVIPAGNPPDAKLTIPALDQTSAQNMYGGVTITHTGEGTTMTETGVNLREVTLEPKELTAYIVATNKLLDNWDAAGTFITTQLRKALTGAEDYDFLRGNGVNRPVGITTAACSKLRNRATAGTVTWADVYTMYSYAKQGGNLTFVASPTLIPGLAAMVDAGNHAVWISGTGVGTGASQSLPGSLMGIPLVFSDRLPSAGTKGDLMLCDFSNYLIKNGSGPFAAVSEHVFFTANKVVFKIRYLVDGKPWLTEPIPLEGDSAQSVSPFVVLN